MPDPNAHSEYMLDAFRADPVPEMPSLWWLTPWSVALALKDRCDTLTAERDLARFDATLSERRAEVSYERWRKLETENRQLVARLNDKQEELNAARKAGADMLKIKGEVIGELQADLATARQDAANFSETAKYHEQRYADQSHELKAANDALNNYRKDWSLPAGFANTYVYERPTAKPKAERKPAPKAKAKAKKKGRRHA